ncbi:hypothetical protein [Antrihabitans sp. YC2-6]|uniref:hypothetical protein n=1 Tax=Antrihabitans sp. YC2-6 TaxID=2799498 RepID=UPI0018F53056|nr:hypothetical protein [Antrihabitans sp. YC2-6]MBJ8346967.1 hypothetical protein [Antrihabitans sp. YC2-6]
MIESADTPEGCWVDISSLMIEHPGLVLPVGRRMRFMWERLSSNGVQDGYDYVASEGVERRRAAIPTSADPDQSQALARTA